MYPLSWLLENNSGKRKLTFLDMVSSHIKTLFPSICDLQRWPFHEKGKLVHDLQLTQWVFNGSRKNTFVTLIASSAIKIWNNGEHKKDEPLSAAGTQVEELLERHRHRIKNNRAPTAADSHPIANMDPPIKKWMKGEAILSIWANSERHIQPASTYINEEKDRNTTNAWKVSVLMFLPTHAPIHAER